LRWERYDWYVSSAPEPKKKTKKPQTRAGFISSPKFFTTTGYPARRQAQPIDSVVTTVRVVVLIAGSVDKATSGERMCSWLSLASGPAVMVTLFPMPGILIPNAREMLYCSSSLAPDRSRPESEVEVGGEPPRHFRPKCLKVGPKVGMEAEMMMTLVS